MQQLQVLLWFSEWSLRFVHWQTQLTPLWAYLLECCSAAFVIQMSASIHRCLHPRHCCCYRHLKFQRYCWRLNGRPEELKSRKAKEESLKSLHHWSRCPRIVNRLVNTRPLSQSYRSMSLAGIDCFPHFHSDSQPKQKGKKKLHVKKDYIESFLYLHLLSTCLDNSFQTTNWSNIKGFFLTYIQTVGN